MVNFVVKWLKGSSLVLLSDLTLLLVEIRSDLSHPVWLHTRCQRCVVNRMGSHKIMLCHEGQRQTCRRVSSRSHLVYKPWKLTVHSRLHNSCKRCFRAWHLLSFLSFTSAFIMGLSQCFPPARVRSALRKLHLFRRVNSKAHLVYKPWKLTVHPRLHTPFKRRLYRQNWSGKKWKDVRSIFDVIRDGDLLVHHPYQSFSSSTQRFVEEAARVRPAHNTVCCLYKC